MPIFSIVMLITALCFLYFVSRRINKNKILFEQAAMWLILGLVMALCAIFPQVPSFFATLLGFQVTSNFLLFLAVLLLLVVTFLQTSQLSKQKEELKNVIQELSILKKEQLDCEKKND